MADLLQIALADTVATKLDAVLSEQLQQANRSVVGIDLETILDGLEQLPIHD
ncbi:MAG: hypothetical protein AB4040_19150 [Synechococcus sp.]